MEENKTKVCITCKRELPIGHFAESITYKDGRLKRCRECSRKKEAKWKERKNAHKFWECDIIAKPLAPYDKDAYEKGKKKTRRWNDYDDE